MTGQQIAFVFGAVTELTGISLASLDIWFDPARASFARARQRARHFASRSWHWFERSVLRRRRTHTVSASSILPFEAMGSATVITEIPADATHDEQLRLLRDLARRIQERLNTLDQQTDSLARNAARNVEALREETRAMIGQAIVESERAYRGWRVLGFALVIVGATIVWVASVW